jgi:undecaprenyl-diphosphatase
VTWWQAIILGVVEGVTEYLPVSSTGHLILTSALLGLADAGPGKAAIDGFTIVVQGGAILAVLGLYRQRVGQMLRGLVGRDRVGARLFRNLVVAFLPAAILGPLAADWVEARLFHPGPVLAALALGGIALLALTPWQRRYFRDVDRAHDGDVIHAYLDIEHLTWRRALLIGALQCVAMWPGTSRAMMAIIGAMLVGLRPRQAAEFSFLLGLPTLGGACAYQLLREWTGAGGGMFQVLGPLPVLLGFACAAASAALAVRWLVEYLSRHGMALFGWYRLALCAVLGILLAADVVAFGAG